MHRGTPSLIHGQPLKAVTATARTRDPRCAGGGGSGSGAGSRPCNAAGPGPVQRGSSSQHQFRHFRHAGQIPRPQPGPLLRHHTALVLTQRHRQRHPPTQDRQYRVCRRGAVGRPAAAAAVTAAAGQAGGRSSPARDAGVGSRGAASARASEMQPPALSDVPVDGPAVQSSASRRRYRLADYIPTGSWTSRCLWRTLTLTW